MPPAETPTGMVTLGPEDVTIAIPNLKPSTTKVSASPPVEETPTGNVTLGPEDVTIAIPTPSRGLPAATMGAGRPAPQIDTGNITLGPEDQTIAIPTNKPVTLPGAPASSVHRRSPASR